jgi:hypothetical protein
MPRKWSGGSPWAHRQGQSAVPGRVLRVSVARRTRSRGCRHTRRPSLCRARSFRASTHSFARPWCTWSSASVTSPPPNCLLKDIRRGRERR